MKAAIGQKPRLKNLDELFKLNDEQGFSVATEVQQTERECKRMQSSIAIQSLTPFPGHPFKLYEGERLDDMVDSIKKYGILVPVIVRCKGDTLEILAGHNRVNAAGLAGLDRVPIIALENVTDEEAWIYIVETNLMQRSFSEMAHSEKAAVIATQHSKLFSQGKRNDILEKLRTLENPHDLKKNEACAQIAHKLKSRDVVAKEYGLSKDTVARYLRIHRLICSLKVRLDREEIPFIPAVNLSFLRENEQELLDKCIGLNDFKVDIKKAELLRQYSESDKLNNDTIYLILSGEINRVKNKRRSYSFKIKPKVYKKYFTDRQRPPEVEEIIEKALDYYFQNKEDEL